MERSAEHKELANRVQIVLETSTSDLWPRKLREEHSARDWSLICLGRELALEGVKKILKGEKNAAEKKG